jgi:hypothetical protein
LSRKDKGGGGEGKIQKPKPIVVVVVFVVGLSSSLKNVFLWIMIPNLSIFLN